MASYKLLIKPSAAKELEAVPGKIRRQLARRIEALADAPRPPGCEKLAGDELYRVRQGDYRVVYSVDDDETTVLVIRVRHRREVYR